MDASNSNFKSFLRQNLKRPHFIIIISFVTMLTAFWVIYLELVTTNIIWNDNWQFLNYVIAFENNNLDFNDLFKSAKRAHVNFFYKVSILINYIFFGWNTKIFVLIGPIICGGAALLLNFWLLYKVPKLNSYKGAIFLSILMLVLFTPAKRAVMHYDMTAYQFHVQLLLFVIAYILADHILADHTKLGNIPTWISLILILLLHTFLIATGQFVAVFFAIGATFCLSLLIVKRKLWGLLLVKASIIITLFILCTMAYMRIVGASTHSIQNKGSRILEEVLPYKYFVYSLSNIGWSQTTLGKIASYFETLNSHELKFLLGLITVALVLYSISLYFITKQYRLTRLPILFIFHALCYMGLVVLGRNGEQFNGTSIALGERYVGTFSLLMVGLVIINIIFLANRAKSIKGTLVKIASKISIIFLALVVLSNATGGYYLLSHHYQRLKHNYAIRERIYLKDTQDITEEKMRKWLRCRKGHDTCKAMLDFARQNGIASWRGKNQE